MRVKEDTLKKILKDNKFKNQFETNTSGGSLSHKHRKQASKNMFGHDGGLKPEEYEKYGYLGHADYVLDFKQNSNFYGAKQYGDIIVRFDKAKLYNRVTFTIDDSLRQAIRGELVAGNATLPHLGGFSTARNDATRYKQILLSDTTNSLKDIVDKTHSRYLELQYHGELTTEYITEICFTGGIKDEAIITRLKDKGIKVYKLVGGKLIEM